MSIETTCPHCNRGYVLKDAQAGRRVGCKGCGLVFRVPRQTQVALLELEPDEEPAGYQVAARAKERAEDRVEVLDERPDFWEPPRPPRAWKRERSSLNVPEWAWVLAGGVGMVLVVLLLVVIGRSLRGRTFDPPSESASFAQRYPQGGMSGSMPMPSGAMPSGAMPMPRPSGAIPGPSGSGSIPSGPSSGGHLGAMEEYSASIIRATDALKQVRDEASLEPFLRRMTEETAAMRRLNERTRSLGRASPDQIPALRDADQRSIAHATGYNTEATAVAQRVPAARVGEVQLALTEYKNELRNFVQQFGAKLR